MNRVGFFAAIGSLFGKGPGVTNPYIHWSATAVITPSDFIKSSTRSSFQESAWAGCSIKKYAPLDL